MSTVHQRGWRRGMTGAILMLLSAGPLEAQVDLSRLTPEQQALVATAIVAFKPGTYEFSTLSDDGIRVFVDDQRIINNWTSHATEQNRGRITLSGKHRIKVCYFQNGGSARLNIAWRLIK